MDLEIREISAASQKEENDLNMIRKEHEEEVGKAQMEVERLQGLLTEVEEENDRMKNAIESLKEDKETQGNTRIETGNYWHATIMNIEAEMEDLQEQHRQEKETMTAEFSKIQAAMGTELTQKEELILELTSKVQESETNIHSIRKGYEMKMAELQEELKNQKALLEEQRDLEAHRNKEAEKERSSMEQTIKDISTELESLRKEQRSVQMLEEQLEHAGIKFKLALLVIGFAHTIRAL
ncbi:Protein CBG26191 [Caenorhabditis briggsae]|uniref:Protein CBG26191 n=1 Tax=Caenorhabditis briggsae TaxID=6238 RepID=B6ILT6_CAEBR|nr:Protein CBG26191 [Caenorhabditis briggsae]CAS00866.1 Protein CBG26191 [Caenorhabditis briggsae]